MLLPVHPVTMPDGLNGQKNGRLSVCSIRPVVFPYWGAMSLYPSAADAAEMLMLAAKLDTGQVMTCTSPGDVYRTWQAQLNVFLDRAEPVDYETWLAADSWRRRIFQYDGHTYWLFHEDVSPVAVPGTSNHGWALAVDFALFVNGRIVNIRSNGLFWGWLAAPGLVEGPWRIGGGSNAESFGFSWEGQRDLNKKGAEPWHLRYVMGDERTPRVRDMLAYIAATGGVS